MGCADQADFPVSLRELPANLPRLGDVAHGCEGSSQHSLLFQSQEELDSSRPRRDEILPRCPEETATHTSFVEACSEDLYFGVQGDETENVAALESICFVTDITNTALPRFFVLHDVVTPTSLSSVVGNVDVSDVSEHVPAKCDADATNKPVLQSVSVGTVALSKGHPLHRSATLENRVWRRFKALPSQTFLLARQHQTLHV